MKEDDNMLYEPIVVFRAHIEKAELMTFLLEMLEGTKATLNGISEEVEKTIRDIGEFDPILGFISYMGKCAIDYNIKDYQDKFELFKKTVREYTIVPAITATETYYKLVYELQTGKEFKGTIGSLDSIKNNISKIDPYKILTGDEIGNAKKGFAFRHVIIHNLGKLDRKACINLGISTVNSGKNISEFLTPKRASIIIDSLKKLVEESNKILTSDSI